MPSLDSYQGIPLLLPETAILKALEQQLEQLIPYRSTFSAIVGDLGFMAVDNHVVDLTLSDQGLMTLPENFGHFSKLQTLDLSVNQLKSLPETFGQLTGLQSLYLRDNQLSTLPESFGNLKSLQELYLMRNQLSSLPASFGNLTRLQTLWLHENQLKSLPESFGNLVNLKELSLWDNQLKSLPESFGNLTNLHNLLFTGNPLAGMVALLWLVRTRSTFRQSWIPGSLFTYPLIQDLDPSSLQPLPTDSCPFCGTLGLVVGLEKQNGKKRVFCASCELQIS
ncbi:MAG: leucine-rich repeat domain-containing protein [Candidatus Hermodarchaeota archaeon]